MTSTSLAAWVVYILVIVAGQAQGSSCPAGEINCRTGNECVNHQYVCNRDNHCSDGSDEDPLICSVWKQDSRCSSGQYYCSRPSNPGCQSLQDFCDSGCPGQERICELVRSKVLEVQENDTGLVLTQEFVNAIQKGVNLTNNTASCPMFYTRVGDACLSFFSPAKVPWPEARQFCLSIGGDLVAIKGFVSHEKLMEYMMTSQFTTDYWIGGRFDVDTNSWSWVNDDTPLPLGSPFWATRYSSSCVPRSPPHTDPFSPTPPASPKDPCYHYLQAPAQRLAGWCAAITYEHYYYFTDEECQEERSPLCLYTGKPH